MSPKWDDTFKKQQFQPENHLYTATLHFQAEGLLASRHRRWGPSVELHISSLSNCSGRIPKDSSKIITGSDPPVLWTASDRQIQIDSESKHTLNRLPPNQICCDIFKTISTKSKRPSSCAAVNKIRILLKTITCQPKSLATNFPSHNIFNFFRFHRNRPEPYSYKKRVKMKKTATTTTTTTRITTTQDYELLHAIRPHNEFVELKITSESSLNKNFQNNWATWDRAKRKPFFRRGPRTFFAVESNYLQYKQQAGRWQEDERTDCFVSRL